MNLKGLRNLSLLPSCSTWKTLLMQSRPASVFTLSCATLALSGGTSAQTGSDTSSVSSPVSFVYVSSNPAGSSTNEIQAFAAAANGKLTPIPGSPFRDDVTSMAVNGKYLFASTRSGIYIAQFAIEASGGLQWTRSTDVVQYNAGECGDSGPLVLDHTGASLYDVEPQGGCGENNLQAFNIEKPSGALQNLGRAGAGKYLDVPLSFTANNKFAYTLTCVPGYSSEANAFRRNASGTLSSVNFKMPIPAAKPGDAWCVSNTATDPSNHLVTTLQPVLDPSQPYSAGLDGPARLATYTVDASGNLSTTSTLANMPSTEAGLLTDISMAPSGKLLAVAGEAGLQVFHYNGASPITHDTDLLAKDAISSVLWDNTNHLYALGAGKLYVFTVTPTSASEAPGSPYVIHNPQGLVIQPK